MGREADQAAGRGRGLLVAVILLVLALALALGYTFAQQKVTVYADGSVTALSTHQRNVAGVLSDIGVQLLPGDQVFPSPEESLQNGMQITVERARVVTVEVDGRVLTRRTQAATLADLFAELGIQVNPADEIIADGVQVILATGSPATLPRHIVIRRSMPLLLADGGAQITLTTSQPTVGRALQEANIALYLGDEVEPPLYTPVTAGLAVTIHRSVPVSVAVDGQVIHTRTHQGSVGDLLGELGVALIGQDYSLPGMEDLLAPNTTIRVVRVLEEIVIEQEPIPYQIAWQPDPNLEIDNQRVAQQGTPGVLQRRIRIRYEDGQEVSRVLEDEWVAHEPASHVIAYGTMIVPRVLETPDGPVEYWRKIRVLATSYTAATSGKDRDHPNYGITAVGWPMRKGIVAVDPRIINLFQELYVSNYGRGIAADTGGAIKGRRIDLGYDENNLVLWYSWVDVYLLTPAPDPSQIRYIIGD